MAIGGLVLGVIAVFLPPLAVIARAGCGASLLINIVLLFLGWVPAVLHAWFVILDKPNARQRHAEKKYERASRSRSRSRSRSIDRHRPVYDRPQAALRTPSPYRQAVPWYMPYH
ncbi:hypothetical protein LTR36_009925 [Oleoguttula mirabilis]|uniref:Plasma membrane proteolipid 3 n=1 Tax=Oleoguttula mirabilis TaxID=1507867 RepID=A0AAV9J5J0_9PEZI|nr:hypothetical protein LTR36_009925 [Oleoguttula mirabilis]